MKYKLKMILASLVVAGSLFAILGSTAHATPFVKCSDNSRPRYVEDRADIVAYTCDPATPSLGGDGGARGGPNFFDLGVECAPGNLKQTRTAAGNPNFNVICNIPGEVGGGIVETFNRTPSPSPGGGGGSAQCFRLAGSPPRAASVPCSRLVGIPIDGTPATPASFDDNKCYLAAWGITVVPSSSAQCRDWRDQAGVEDPAADGGGGGGGLLDPDRRAISECDGSTDCINDNPLVVITKLAINILSGAVGVVLVSVIVIAGIQYSSSGGNPASTAAAKKRIINAIIALAAYMFLFIGLQWLIPGGLL